MAEEKKGTALALTSHAIEGTIEQKILVYDQIAANIASLALNGWNTVQKAKAGCWLADGTNEHPAIFMQNHYVMEIKSKLSVTPRWEYVVRKLNETIPNFKFKVIHNTDDAAKVEMSDGVNTHEYEYTVADAKRSGLFNRPGGNAWTEGNTREMCLARAVKRCGALMGLGRAVPWVDVEMEPTEPEKKPASASSATVVDEGGPTSEGGGESASPSSRQAENSPRGAQTSVTPATTSGPQKPKDPVLALSTVLVKMYGKQPVKVALEKASLIYNEMLKEQTGTAPNPPVAFKMPKEIGPVEAQQMIEYLAKRRPSGSRDTQHGQAAESPAAPEAVESSGSAPPESEAPPAGEDVPPEAEVFETDHADAEMDAFNATVRRAQKLFGRGFVKEAPPGSAKFWFVDQTTFSQIGGTGSIKLVDGDDVVIPLMDLRRLHEILRNDCDAKERGGR